ncbi:MAG: glycosyltransferase, partial [Candidatus Cloacimonetes bacterium]|nr:glycosyltransferase [Candidatus Cloacimonadota bacterium]
HQNIHEYYSTHDIFVLSSLSESFSVVTAEALASGLPCVITRCGGPETFFPDFAGRIVPPADWQALASAIEDVRNNLTEYPNQKIADYARELFDFQHVARQIVNVYEELV